MPTLFDHLGRPVNTGKLTQEHGAPSIGGVRTVWTTPVATSLTPEFLASTLLAAAEGDTESYLVLAEEMEEREAHYFSVLRTRKSAVAGLLPFVEAASDDAEDVKIADAVTELMGDENLVDTYKDLLDGIAKSYSMVEIIWDTDGRTQTTGNKPIWIPERYEWRDPRFFGFDDDTLNKIGLLTDAEPNYGEPLAPYKWIQHIPRAKTGITIRGGLARLICAYYMLKSYSLKDWMAFAEVFGMPIRSGTYAAGATEDDIDTLVQAVDALGTDAAAVFPETMKVEITSAAQGAGGGPLFMGLAEYLDKQTSKAVLGQTMTTDDGASLSQAKVHEDVRQDIRDDDARQLAKTLRRDLIAPFVALNFGADKAVPKFKLALEETEDLKEFSDAITPFIDRGLRVQSSIILDKFSIQEAEEGAEVLQPKGGGGVAPGEDEEEEKDDEDEGDEEKDEGDGEDEKARAQNALVAHLASRARTEPETLTDDQWKILAVSLAREDQDEIDRLSTKAVRGWRGTISELTDSIVEAAGEAQGPEDFRARLAALDVNTDELVSSLALEFFKARGTGDATDNNR
jgi:phage gp29-like protein